MNDKALRIALKIIKMFEGCNLISYPDPCSPLYEALSNNNMLRKYMQGKLLWNDLPEHFQALSGNPWTIGAGETLNVTHSMQWTQEEADKALEARVAEFMSGVLKAAPKLSKASPEALAACTSLAYNIGLTAFSRSSVAKAIAKGDSQGAAEAFLLWNRAAGKIVDGLAKRRKIESDLFRTIP